MLRRLFYALIFAAVVLVLSNTFGFALPPLPLPTTVRDYRYPLVDAPRDAFPCLPSNPTCPPATPWWVSWPTGEEEHEASLVQFAYLSPSIVAERRFIEPINLLYQWEEGRQLLLDAGAYGVHIRSAPEHEVPGAVAFFSRYLHVIGFNQKYTEISIFLQSMILSHELSHLQDAKLASPFWNLPSCVAQEQKARQTERRFLQWLTSRMGALPTPEMVKHTLSEADNEVFRVVPIAMADVQEVNAQTARAYHDRCK